MEDSTKKDILFSGKWMTGEPASIGMNFRTLKNMRYTDTHIEGVSGMTKVNVSAVMNANYFKARNAHHFKKSQPAESHVLVQAYNSALTASQVLDNKTAIPNQGNFAAAALWTDTSGAGLGRFSNAPDGQVIYANGVDTCMWGGDENKCGAVISIQTALSAAGDSLTNPLDYTEQANNTKSDSANAFECGSTYKTFLLGSTRPASGATFYISSVNVSANTLAVKESTAGAWTALTVTSDTTRTGGTTSFAQNGKVVWGDTTATTKKKYLGGYYLYWYQFTIDAGTAGIYHVTLDCPFQAIVDSWDGVYGSIAKTYLYTTSQSDKSTNVLLKDYDAASASTYMDISSMTSAQYIECGFTEKQTALYLSIPPEYVNGSACTPTVLYWNGASYVTVGDVSDGTAVGAVSLAKTGVISWNNSSLAAEQKLQYANAEPLYYYAVQWSATVDASVRIEYIGGIIASKTLSYYKFPVFAQGRVLLCADMAGDKFKATVSSKFMPQVFNGDDSVDVYFGDEGELTCGTELFSQYGSSLYSLIVMYKDTETWILAGQDIAQWENNTFLLSSSIGCPAPLTLKTINLRAEPGAGINRALAIWQGSNGVYMSDGRAPIPIHGDIKEYFDRDDTRCINASKVGDSTGFVDDDKQEYHLLIASGTDATTLNTELVYDIVRNRWFEIDRSSDLQCGVNVHDTYGNPYTYGFLDTGYMERLENGTDFDGTSITCTVQFGDIPLGGLDIEARMSDFSLYTVAQTNDITCTVYTDTSSTGTAHTMAHTSSTRLAMPDFDDKLNGYFHSIKLSTTGKFEPLAAVAWFHKL